MTKPTPEIARALEAHYTKGAGEVTPPPPRFRSPPARPRLTPLGLGVVTAVLLALLVGSAWMGARSQQTATPLAGLGLGQRLREQPRDAATPQDDCPDGTSGPQRLPAGCRIEFDSPRMTVTTTRETHLVVGDDHVTLERGWAVFDVEHRVSTPLIVGFDGGEIRVLGTAFSVFQDALRGHVELVEGAVEIVDARGVAHRLEPGGRYGWNRGSPIPSAADNAPPAASAPPQPRGTKAPPTESVDEVARLRSKKAYGQARALLERLRSRASSPRERAVLEYELGTILEAEGASVDKRCKHWQRFAKRHPKSAYTDAVATRLAALDCAATQPSRDSQ